MSNWVSVLNKNKIEFETKIEKNLEKTEIIEENNDFSYNLDFFRDIDDEFEHKYLTKICDLKYEFKKYIENECLPFINKSYYGINDFYDFIKYNCTNYYTLEEEINQEYEKMIEEENNIEETFEDNYSDYEI
jgi:hypothetical protein